MRTMFFCFLAVLTFVCGLFQIAYAGSGAVSTITEDMIVNAHKTMEDVLNDRGDYQKAIHFLHTYYSDDAQFRMTVTNPIVAGNEKSPIMEMDKEGYINSYIQGSIAIADYSFAIKTKKFQHNPKDSYAFTLDVITERGVMKSSINEGKDFVSTTICRTRHELREENLQATASECHTDISFEEAI